MGYDVGVLDVCGYMRCLRVWMLDVGIFQIGAY